MQKDKTQKDALERSEGRGVLLNESDRNSKHQSWREEGSFFFFFCCRMVERAKKLETGGWLRRKKTRTWGTSWTDEFSASDTQSDCAVLIGVGRSFQFWGDGRKRRGGLEQTDEEKSSFISWSQTEIKASVPPAKVSAILFSKKVKFFVFSPVWNVWYQDDLSSSQMYSADYNKHRHVYLYILKCPAHDMCWPRFFKRL